MKKLSVFLFLFFCTMIVWSQGICFEQGTFEQALSKAKAENKMLFVDAYAVWCGPCKVMSNTVFKDKEVGEYFAEHVVALKIDVERGEGPHIREKYAIEGLPGYVFMDGDGNVVYRAHGSMPKEDFMKTVKQAYTSMLSPNSVGRLAARYEQEKNDEQFLSLYLQRLLESNSVGYVDVLEQYLAVQKSIRPDSREMAKLLNDHYQALIYGGRADHIINQYAKCEAWRQYVRKDVRERFQKLPKIMAERTTEYAIEKRDSSFIDLAIRRAMEMGMGVAADQKKRSMIYFYKNTGQGEPYKQLMGREIETYYNGLDTADLKAKHWMSRQKYANQPNVKYRSFAMKAAEELKLMASDYAAFVVTDEEKSKVLSWARTVYELAPDELAGMSFYANALYLFGDKELAISLKKKALQMAVGTKSEDAQRLDLQAMQEGKTIKL